ncbi:MAG: hypothetical protein ACLFWD_00790 [Anaerolineales bacterium]
MNQEARESEGRLTRLIATLVLIPTVPMLLAAVAALGLFYLAPGRFGALLARLPGDELIRSVLIFAPAMLFAVVVLAVLYALDRPPAAESAQLELAEETPPAGGINAAKVATWGMLVPGLPLLILSVGLWLFSFIAPSRFAALIEPLPGDAYLQLALRAAPVALLAVVVPAALYLLLTGRRATSDRGGGLGPAGPVRWGVALTLLATVPLLGFSLLALGTFLFSPARFDSMLAQFTQESFLRLALVFIPAVLLSLVLLAVLFLFYSKPSALTAEEAEAGAGLPFGIQRAREGVAIWVLTGGLAGSAVVALGLLGVTLYLLIR